MMIRYLFISFMLATVHQELSAQDPYQHQRANWLNMAAATKPSLLTTVKRPQSVVTISKDTHAYQGYAVSTVMTADSFYTRSIKKQSGIILDFGEHLTGYVEFNIEDLAGVTDAPIRLKFTFAEMPAEAVLPFDPYNGGLSRAWLQDEIITVSEVPSKLIIPRRVSFRYVKIEVLASSGNADCKISDLLVKATSSVKHQPEALLPGTPALIKK